MTLNSLLWLTSLIHANSVDCIKMVQFGYDLGIQNSQPLIWTQLQIDCCAASGVFCDGSQRVKLIHWNDMELNGTINGTAIPSNVELLWLYRNQITSSIPSELPGGLVELYLHGNKMSGDLPSFPSTLQHLALGYF